MKHEPQLRAHRRILPWALATALLAGCGGNLSNADLEFYFAMPDKDELKTRVPGATTSQALGQSGQGLSTRSWALDAVGATSQFYVETKKTSDNINAGIEALLGHIDLVRQLPPTHRTEDSRIWGPFPIKEQPDFLFRFTITHVQTQYLYALEFSRKDAIDFKAALTGSFDASAGVQHGTGQLAFQTAALKAIRFPLDATGTATNSVVVQYQTRSFPIHLAFQLDSNDPARVANASYTYDEDEDGSGALAFDLQQQAPSGVNTLRLTSQWLPDGTGRGDGQVQQGPNLSGHETDCWAAAPSFPLTYQSRTWEGAIGDPAACPASFAP